ncbi:MAG: ferredoxin [Solirubrobacterales bacterium]|jgi:ferredoxin|nr:ferredoxin [Solirubrobacterales bacterium]
MKVTVDATKCQAYGRCHEHAPEVFDLDEWGYAKVLNEGDLPPELEQMAREAEKLCPAGAISAAS